MDSIDSRKKEEGVTENKDSNEENQKNNSLGKSKVESSATHNTHNTDDTDDTDNTNGSVLSVLCSNDISKRLFGDEILEKILQIFATSDKYFTYEELSKELGKDPANIRQAINRKKEYFLAKKPDGRKTVLHLSQLGVDFITSRIEEIKQIEERRKEFIQDQKQDQTNREELENEIFTFAQAHKPKRIGNVIILDFEQLLIHNISLADYLLREPQKFIALFMEKFGEKYKLKVINLPQSQQINIEDKRVEHSNKMVTIEGRVTSFGDVRPLVTEIRFECPSCGTTIVMEQDYRTPTIREPEGCSCGRRGKFREITRKEINALYIQLEDLQDNIENPHPQRLKAILFNDLIDKEELLIFTPGNEVKVVGILKKVERYFQGRKTLFSDWIFEIISVDLIEKEIDISQFSDEDNIEIKRLAYQIDMDGMHTLSESFAPDIFGYDAIKKALILQCCNKRNHGGAVRNKSNILLIGDPGVAKSVLGDFAMNVTYGSKKAVGGGSSGVGITASVVKEEDILGGFRVEPGSMILSKETLFIDELNNLADEDKPKLQEGMNEQRITINKANIHVQMKVTCGIIAVANPKHGYFKEGDHASIAEQFNIPAPILNRFDTVFVMRDEVDFKRDVQIAEKMLQRQRGLLKPQYSKEFLKKFFTFVRLNPEPEVSDEMGKYILEIYPKARKIMDAGVKINARFLESLTRMAIASAKLRLSSRVEKKDVEIALQILSESQYNISEQMGIKNTKP